MFEVMTTEKLQEEEVRSAVQQGLHSFLGIYGCAKAGVALVKNTAKGGVIKVQPKYVDQVKTAMALIKEINKKQVLLKCTRVSGMLHNVSRGGVTEHAAK